MELRITEQGRDWHMASEGTLSYMVQGVYYSISIPALCELYGFDPAPELVQFSDTPDNNTIWKFIADGKYRSNTAKQSAIRNRVIRFITRGLSNTLFC